MPLSSSPSPVSIIVPAFREAPNLEPLVERIFATLREAGIEGELIIIDDNSQDSTEKTIESLQKKYPVRLLIRRDERGLSSAVLEGFKDARFDRFVVMDADLQHPPEMIPALLERMDRNQPDFILGTRYGQGGAIIDAWPWWRRFGSRVATLLARPLALLSDPLSGFFAIPRSTWDRARSRLDPIGYKIGLELFVKGRCRQHEEVPIKFDIRRAGRSKFGLAEQLRYVRHLIKLYRFRFPILFAVVLLMVLGGIVSLVYWMIQIVGIG